MTMQRCPQAEPSTLDDDDDNAHADALARQLRESLGGLVSVVRSHLIADGRGVQNVVCCHSPDGHFLTVETAFCRVMRARVWTRERPRACSADGFRFLGKRLFCSLPAALAEFTRRLREGYQEEEGTPPPPPDDVPPS